MDVLAFTCGFDTLEVSKGEKGRITGLDLFHLSLSSFLSHFALSLP